MAHDALTGLLQPGTDAEMARSLSALAERSAGAMFGLEDEVAFLDVETTGFDPAFDEIIEIALLVARGPQVVRRASTLVRTSRPIPREIAQLTGIDDAMCTSAPSAADAVRLVAEVVGERDVVAHNAAFDRQFLEAAGWLHPRGEQAWLDSLDLARIALPRMRSHRLTDLGRAFGLLAEPAHRATSDVETLFRLWRLLLAALGDLPPEVVSTLAAMGGGGWPLARVFAQFAIARGTTRLDLKVLRQKRLKRERPHALKDAADAKLEAPDEGDVIGEFDAAGAVGRMYVDYETRAEQVEMARAVLEALAGGGHTAIEAGTGVGKSVAYLVPAARFALANGVAVGVATKTNTLMDQLLNREIPALARQMPGLRFVGLKGYEHYLCLRKLKRALDAEGSLDAEARTAVAMLLAWVASTSWGDLDAVNLHWRPALRHAVAANAAECTKKRCAYHAVCYLHGQRRQARQAHIVVTNHALLFRDVMTGGQILPPVRHWVVDEAHGAEAEARAQLSLEATQSACRSALGALHVRDRGGLLASVRARLPASGPGCAAAEEMSALVEETKRIAESFFSGLAEMVQQDEHDAVRVRVTSAMREDARWGLAASVGRSLIKRLDRLIRSGSEVVTALEEEGDVANDVRADLAGQLSALADAREALLLALDGDDDRYVYVLSVERRRDGTDVALGSMLLDVGEALAERFYQEVMAVIYTSATIATGDDFSHFERSVGLDRLPPGSHRTLRLASSYDFERQMTVYVPTGLTPPGSPRYADDLERLLFDVHVAMGGSVLTLFTNRRVMRDLYERLAGRLEREGLRLVVQSRGVSTKRIAEEFIADERLSLFATKSFWEGFDAKGDTLRCVVVTKLPFAQVNDPLLEARKERDPQWWSCHYLPAAVLELKQAAGRLIRSSTDTGCLVLADARLDSRHGYARAFFEALPVQDVERVPVERMREVIAARFGRRCG